MKKLIKKTTAILVAATLVLTPIMVSADETTEHLSATRVMTTERADELMELLPIAGMTIAVVDTTNDFTWLHSVGYANAPTQTHVTENTLFNIASTSKLFTAVAIMQLVEAGILDLDEPIVTYLPDFSMLPHPVFGGDYRNITTRMLFTHTSGLHEYGGAGFFSLGYSDRYLMNRLVPNLQQMHMQNAELNRITYSNTNYALLGILVAVLGAPEFENYFDGFVHFVQENIFTPAGMASSSFAVTSENMPYIATPHTDATTPAEAFVSMGATASGGMVTSAYDMAQFMRIMLTGGGNIISQETLQEMIPAQYMGINYPSELHMGLGIMHMHHADGIVTTGHGGNLQHHTEFLLDFENGIGVFISGNSAASAGASSPLANIILRSAVEEKTGTALQPTQINRAGLVTGQLEGSYTVINVGAVELVTCEYGFLHFVGLAPFPITLTPNDDGTFDSLMGNVWFKEANDTVFAMLGAGLFAERIEVTPATPEFERWVGDYYYWVSEDLMIPVTYVGIDALGRSYMMFDGGVYLMERIDDYTFLFPNRMRTFGSIAEFSMYDDWIILRYGALTLVRALAVDIEEPEEPQTVRFVIGNTELTRNDATHHQLEAAPFIDDTFNRTMVHYRDIAEIFGAEVTLTNDEVLLFARTIAANIAVAMTISEPFPHEMGRIMEINGQIFVPITYVAHVLGANIRWDGENQAVYIYR